MTQISELKYTISIQEKTITNDNVGGFLESWITTHIVHAKVEFQNVSQYVVAQKVVREKNVKITIRDMQIDDVKYRLIIENNIYKINIIRKNSKNFLEMICSSVI